MTDRGLKTGPDDPIQSDGWNLTKPQRTQRLARRDHISVTTLTAPTSFRSFRRERKQETG